MPLPGYTDLRDQVQLILSQGRTHSRRATEWERVETYWHIGDALFSHISAQSRADYGQQVVDNLSKDIGLSRALLFDALRFRRLLPIVPPRRQLAFTHYRKLVRLPTQEQFRYYEHLADDQHWSVRQLQDAIRADAYTTAISQPLAVPLDQDPLAGGPALRARFGPFYIYRLIQSPGLADAPLYLDLGFAMTCHLPLGGLNAPRPDQLVTASRRPDNTWAFSPVPDNTPRYTFAANITRVVDGDTLLGVADPGLDHRTWTLRFRLRGIDCPELNTLAGRNARDFVTDALAQVRFVVIRTHQTDNYGRYLVDLRYLPGEPDPDVVRTRGIYLNRQLLDQRLARRYPD